MVKIKRRGEGEENLRVESTPIDDMNPHPQNTRVRDERATRAIMASLEEFGQRTPIVLGRHGYILKGNGTWEAAKRLGWDRISTVKVTHLTDDQELAYSIADNRTGDLSEFDYEALGDAFVELSDAGYSLDVTGFSDFEVEPLLSARRGEEEEKEGGEEAERKRFPRNGIIFADSQWETVNEAFELSAADDLALFVTFLCERYIKAKRK